MESIVKACLPQVVFQALTDSRLANQKPSYHWLPDIVLTSWERQQSMYAFHTIERIMSLRLLGNARDSIPLLVYPFRSLEMNEQGLYEITTCLRSLMLRTWWMTNKSHLMQTWLAFSVKPKLTFEEWLDITTDVEASGANLFDEIPLTYLKAIVHQMQSRPLVATRVWSYMTVKIPAEKMIDWISLCFSMDEMICLGIMSLRIDLFVDKSMIDLVCALSIRHNYQAFLTQFAYFQGLWATNAYWPDNCLPDMQDIDVYNDELVEATGIYVPSGWDIDDEEYDVLQRGNAILGHLQSMTFKQLLKSNIETLSAWCSDVDPPGDMYRSLALYMQKNLSNMPVLWASSYKVNRKTRKFWIQAILKMNVSLKQCKLRDDMLLIVMFDRAQYTLNSLDDVGFCKRILSPLIKDCLPCASPELLVAIVGAILFDMSSLESCVEIMCMIHAQIDVQWKEAIDLMDRELDRWLSLKALLMNVRSKRRDESIAQYFPVLQSSKMVMGDMPSYIASDWRASYHLPARWPTLMSKQRTMEQVISIARTLTGLPAKSLGIGPLSCRTLYRPSIGVHTLWKTRRVIAHMVNGLEHMKRVQLQMEECSLVAVEEEIVNRARVYTSVRSFDVAMGQAMKSSLLTLDKEHDDEGVEWMSMNNANELFDDQEDASERWHIMLVIEWRCLDDDSRLVSWESSGAVQWDKKNRQSSKLGLAGWTSDVRAIMMETQEDSMVSDTFVGPLIHPSLVKGCKGRVPAYWSMRSGYSMQPCKLVYELDMI